MKLEHCEDQMAVCGRCVFANISSCERCAQRGGRYPARAHDGAVSASLRLRCGARSAVAPRNSLHSLRSCRSNSLGGSDHEARAARAPTPLLRSSPPQKSPAPGTAHRADTLVVFVDRYHSAAGKAVGGCAPAATYAAPRNGRLAAARAKCALQHLTRRDCLSAANEVSEASFSARPQTEQHSAVGAKRRPPQHEPIPGGAHSAASAPTTRRHGPST